MGFLLFTVVAVILGILIRVFWLELYILYAIVLAILAIIVSSAMTAFVVVFFKALFTDGSFDGFGTVFKYCAVFFTVVGGIYIGIINDIYNAADGFSFKWGNTFTHYKKKK